MPGFLNGREAAAHVGVSPPDITKAIKAGLLPAQERLPGKRSQGVLIPVLELERWAATRRTIKRFSEADVAALLELSATCTWEQVGAYLGFSARVCSNKALELRRKGIAVDKLPGRRHSIPWAVGNKAILLAKTCTRCGILRDASQFLRNNGRLGQNYSTLCRTCNNKQLRLSPARQKQRENEELLNEVTTQTAVNSGLPYTAADDLIISDTSKSVFEIALQLGRTYNGIQYRQEYLGVRYTSHKPRTRKENPRAIWVIEFPNALVALQQHYAKIGRAVPEELWEWTDNLQELAS